MNHAGLLQNSHAVNRVAARVAFSRGCHYEPKPQIADVKTWDAPPQCDPRPADAPDYSGIRHGHMTAFRYYRSGDKYGGTLWLVRCDCGRYETRRIRRWVERTDPPARPDSCQFCLGKQIVRQRGGQNAQAVAAERLLAWGKSMLQLGLTHEEVTQILSFSATTKDPGVQTRGKTAEEIRESLRAAIERREKERAAGAMTLSS